MPRPLPVARGGGGRWWPVNSDRPRRPGRAPGGTVGGRGAGAQAVWKYWLAQPLPPGYDPLLPADLAI